MSAVTRTDTVPNCLFVIRAHGILGKETGNEQGENEERRAFAEKRPMEQGRGIYGMRSGYLRK